MEKLGFLKVTIVLVFFAAATLLVTEPADWFDLVTVAPSSVGQIPEVPELGAAALFGAVALAGSGGFANLAVSNWVRDKGLGMGAYIPRIVSPVTGQEESAPSTGHFFPQDEENLARWRSWWRVANLEQFLTFFAIGIVGTVVMSVLSYSTVFGQDVGTEFDFIRAEGEAFQEAVAPWFGTFFWLVGTALLFYTTVANFDAVGRLAADALKINWLAESRFWSQSKIYATIVWTLALIGTLILASGLSAPLTLLVISAVVTGLIMFVYSILFIKLNRGVLPAGVRMSGFRLAAMVWAVLFFGVFALFTIVEQVRTLLSGG